MDQVNGHKHHCRAMRKKTPELLPELTLGQPVDNENDLRKAHQKDR